MKELVQRHDAAIFGYWDGPTRVKGVMEKQDDAIESFATLKDSLENTTEQVKSIAWSIGKPVLIFMAILVLLGIGAILVAGYGILHPDVLHTVTGR